MYDFLKDLAEQNDWLFEYSRKDYLNLYDGMSDNTTHLFATPITIESSFSDSGFEVRTASGVIMFLVSSDVDEEYILRYNNYIIPLLEGPYQILKDALSCSKFDVNKLQCLEMVNLFDFNMDGLYITYSITLNE